MTLTDALLLGIVQGLTEFIPVSSTAHLLIAQSLLGIPAGAKTFAFHVIIQLGTVLALLLFFWRDLWQILQAFLLGLWHRRPLETHQAALGWLLIIATLPAALFGFLLKDYIKAMFLEPLGQAGVRLIVTAFLLALVERLSAHRRSIESVTWIDALAVGTFQILSLFPGASRSGSTIAGALLCGLDRTSAARFAFLMSAPILLIAGLHEIVYVVGMPGTRAFLPYLATGFLVSAIVGWLSIKWLLRYLSKHSLYLFAGYCAALGSLTLLLR